MTRFGCGDVATGEPISTLEGHADAVYSVSFSPDGTTLGFRITG